MATRRAYRKRNDQPEAEVQYDPFQDFEGSTLELYTSKFFYWVRENIKQVLIGIAVITVVVIALATYDVYRQNQEDKAREAFTELEKNPLMTPGAGDATVAVKRLEEYREKHTTESAQRRAYHKEIELLEADGKNELAARAASNLARNLDTPELKAYFHLKAAFLFEQSEKTDAALSEYEQFASRIIDEPFLQAVALFNQGRLLLEKGRVEPARQAFRQLLTIEDTSMIEEYRAAAAALLIETKL